MLHSSAGKGACCASLLTCTGSLESMRRWKEVLGEKERLHLPHRLPKPLFTPKLPHFDACVRPCAQLLSVQPWNVTALVADSYSQNLVLGDI